MSDIADIMRAIAARDEYVDLKISAAIRDARNAALEEAADAVGEVGDHADAGSYINAIRALVKEPQP